MQKQHQKEEIYHNVIFYHIYDITVVNVYIYEMQK